MGKCCFESLEVFSCLKKTSTQGFCRLPKDHSVQKNWKNTELTHYLTIQFLEPEWALSPWGWGGGYSHTLPMRVCAAQRDFEAPGLELSLYGVFSGPLGHGDVSETNFLGPRDPKRIGRA